MGEEGFGMILGFEGTDGGIKFVRRRASASSR